MTTTTFTPDADELSFGSTVAIGAFRSGENEFSVGVCYIRPDGVAHTYSDDQQKVSQSLTNMPYRPRADHLATIARHSAVSLRQHIEAAREIYGDLPIRIDPELRGAFEGIRSHHANPATWLDNVTFGRFE